MRPERILIVDDESTVLELYTLYLADEFAVDTAENAESALQLVSAHEPYAVVVADMHLPGISGSEFLRHIEDSSPDTVRIMVTADHQQSVAVEAVNRGQVFRFLNKPCHGDELKQVVRAGVQQYRARLSEKELLASTVNGSVNLLSEVLALVNPLAFGRARRIKHTVEQLCERLAVPEAWELSIAAMLSQLGCLSLPDELLRRATSQEALSADESRQWASHPQLGHDLVSRIPRLERVARIILLQNAPYQAASGGEPDCRTTEWRASCLRAAIELDRCVESGLRPEQAVVELSSAVDEYPTEVSTALAAVVESDRDRRVRSLNVSELLAGMILDEHLVDTTGRILLTKGYLIANWVLDRLRHGMESGCEVREPIRVIDPSARDSVQIPEDAPAAPSMPWVYCSGQARVSRLSIDAPIDV